MLDTLPLLLNSDFPKISRRKLETLQVNLGYKCNQSCKHCHVNAGPNRTEQMSLETIQQILQTLKTFNIKTLDVTGGAPELNEHFKFLVEQASIMRVHIIDRCNLTILNEAGHEDLARFLAKHKVEIVASLPCYLEENVDAQRGNGVYQKSITGLQKLNNLGYGKKNTGLTLNLMFNPAGPNLPPPQVALEKDYRKILFESHGIEFNHLFSLVNMPIKRFGSTLLSHKQFDDYMALLKASHKNTNLDTVMCCNLISIDWQGHIYDCDFNQMLDLPMKLNGYQTPHLRDLINHDLNNNPIVVADHCYGCTAGQGSSCGGALS
ncbi:MAG: arsenosugar biosynthesis radical SAM protein ArsS [Gammaproteobacteria bacterium]|nr:arsenosugar biosynthesis radical SAM protein ArsS [Gammaproteobacteria bacterium]MCW9004446.1 arsenosugar biosynthesis radical SAM protein ArsS [Gammaproteobacteria bacterium]